MAWSSLSADRPLPNEGALRYGLGAAALPLWAPFLAAAGAGVAWWWATAWTRQGQIPASAASAPRRIEVKPAPAAQPAGPIATTVLATSAEVAEMAADVRAVAALETAPLHSDAEAVKAAVAEVVAGARSDGSRPSRKKSAGPKATV